MRVTIRTGNASASIWAALMRDGEIELWDNNDCWTKEGDKLVEEGIVVKEEGRMDGMVIYRLLTAREIAKTLE